MCVAFAQPLDTKMIANGCSMSLVPHIGAVVVRLEVKTSIALGCFHDNRSKN